MTPEQKRARRISGERGKIKELKDHCICTCESGRDYVFISYKSDSWERVFEDILYEVCYKYGLQIYVDTNFDDNAATWIEQFQDNMNSPCCRAVIAFMDNAYYSSYATLMEVMARRTRDAGGIRKYTNQHPFLPIELEKKRELSGAERNKNTGLGTKRFKDGTENPLADEELRTFNELFRTIIEEEEEDDQLKKDLKHYYKEEKYNMPDEKITGSLYWEKTEGSPKINKEFLNVNDCRLIMDAVLPKKNVNDGESKSFVEVIHDKLMNMGLGSVFDESRAHWERTAPQPPQPEPSHANAAGGAGAVSPAAAEKPAAPAVDAVQNVGETAEGGKADASAATAQYIAGKKYEAWFRHENEKSYTVLKGSRIAPDWKTWTPSKRHDELAAALDGSNILQRDVTFEAVSTAAKFIQGTSTAGGTLKTARTVPYPYAGGAPVPARAVPDGTQTAAPQPSVPLDEEYVYKIFGREYRTNVQADMMYDTYEALIERYPEKAEALTRVNSVARVADVTDADGELKAEGTSKFRVRKEYMVGGTKYYVGTSYGIDAKKSQVRAMLKVCGVSESEFEMIQEPGKVSCGGSSF